MRPKVHPQHAQVSSGPATTAWVLWAWVSLPVTLAALCFLNSLDGGFVWDDRQLIVADRAITSWRNLGEIFANDFFYRSEDDVPYGYYRPLTTASYLLNYQRWGLDPFGYHLTNIVLHCLATALVMRVLLQLGCRRAVAILAAVLFAVHPLHSENVAWIAGRTDLLAFVFGGLTLSLFLRAGSGSGAPGADVRSRQLMWIAALLCFVAALLAKEVAVVTAAWLVLIERGLRRRSWREVASEVIVPYGAIVAAYGVWRFGISDIPVPGVPAPEHSLTSALLTLPFTLLRYLIWMVWPYPLNAYVQNPYVATAIDPRCWATLLLLTGLGVWIAHQWSRSAQVAAAATVIGFLPVLNLVRLAGPADMGSVMAERFCYLPSFPFCGLAAIGAAHLWDRKRTITRLALVSFGGLALLAMILLTVSRNRVWHDEHTFLATTLAENPTAALLWSNLAIHHLEQRELDEAAKAVAAIERLRPGSYRALAARASFYVASDRFEEALPLQQRIVASSNRGRAVARNNLAYLYRRTGEPEKALAILQRLIDEGHGYADVYFNAGEIHRARGDLDRARRYLRLAHADRPTHRHIGSLLASLEVEGGNLAAADRVYRRLLSAYPRDPRLLNNRALVRYESGEIESAFTLWRRALDEDPAYTDARLNYARALDERGRTNGALRQLKLALERERGGPREKEIVERMQALQADNPSRAGQ